MSIDTKNKTQKKTTKARKITMYWATWIVLVVMFAISFYLPPTGIIDGSVLRAGCILISIPLLASFESIVSSIKSGQKIKLQHGNLTAEVSQKNEEENQIL